MACSSRSRNSTRLGRPVRLSKLARKLRRAWVSLRSVMSRRIRMNCGVPSSTVSLTVSSTGNSEPSARCASVSHWPQASSGPAAWLKSTGGASQCSMPLSQTASGVAASRLAATGLHSSTLPSWSQVSSPLAEFSNRCISCKAPLCEAAVGGCPGCTDCMAARHAVRQRAKKAMVIRTGGMRDRRSHDWVSAAAGSTAAKSFASRRAIQPRNPAPPNRCRVEFPTAPTFWPDTPCRSPGQELPNPPEPDHGNL